MKQPGEELQETLTELDDRAVVDYLIKNPEFFIRNARAVEAIRVPHPVRGTVSLVEWHMARARNHIHVLEENMALLMEQAIANEGLFYRLLYLQRSLTAASSLDDMLMRFQRLGQEQHYLGPLNGPELLVVLPEAKAVGSVAMSMLGSDADLGVVLFTSRDASHYQQGQGTQLLHEIALMLPELLERWIERV